MPGTTRTSDLVWWWRQRVNDLGLGTWFQPSVDVQRKGVNERAARRRPGHPAAATCCTATSASPSRGSTPTRSTSPTCCGPARPTRPPASSSALANANALQDIAMEEIAPGPHRQRDSRRGRATRMKAQGHRRHDLLAPDRPARPRRRAAHRPVGLPGRRARPRRREGHPDDVVLDRAAGDDAGAGVGRPAGADGAGRRRDHRRRRQDALGAASARTSCSSYEALVDGTRAQ